MRELYLVRHGEAVPESENQERPLSLRGIKDSRRLAAHLRKSGLAPGQIWHSTKLRARQTALVIAGEIASEERTFVKKGLGPDDNVEAAREMIEDFFQEENKALMIVSHLPFIPELSSLLLANGNGMPLFVPCSSCLCLARDNFGPWILKWLVEPEIFG